MRQVDPQLYAGVDRGERRRIAKEIEHLKARRDAALEMAAHLRAAGQPEMAKHLESANLTPPLRLLACSECHRPVPLCACGFEWGAL